MGRRGPLAGTNKRGAPTGIRFDPELKARINEAKIASRRSFSEEVTARLEASFSAIEFGNPQTRNLATVLALALELERERTGFTWFENAWAWAGAKAAINAVLSLMKPSGATDVVPDDAALLVHLRLSSLGSLLPQVAEQLKDASLGENSGKAAIGRMEMIADGTADPSLNYLKEAARATKDALQAFDTDTVARGDLLDAVLHEEDREKRQVAKLELQRAAGVPMIGTMLDQMEFRVTKGDPDEAKGEEQ